MWKKTLPILILGLAMTTGCETLGLGGDEDTSDDDRVSRDDRTSRDDRISRDDDPAGRGRGGFEMKYPSDYDNGIPTGARLVREDNGRDRITHKPAHDGRLYLYDVDDRRVVDQFEMRDGDNFVMDVRDERAMVNDRSINARINRDHRYRLYFVESGGAGLNRDRNLDRDLDRDRDRSGVIRPE